MSNLVGNKSQTRNLNNLVAFISLLFALGDVRSFTFNNINDVDMVHIEANENATD